MMDHPSLEGWAPVVGDEVSLETVVDLAFDYRGDVTVVTRDGRELTGFVANRDRVTREPFLTLFDASGATHTVRYSNIQAINFTGKDTAAGKSYDAWLRRRADARST